MATVERGRAPSPHAPAPSRFTNQRFQHQSTATQFPILATCRLSGEPIRSIQSYESREFKFVHRRDASGGTGAKCVVGATAPAGAGGAQEEAQASQGASRLCPYRDMRYDVCVDGSTELGRQGEGTSVCSRNEGWERSCMDVPLVCVHSDLAFQMYLLSNGNKCVHPDLPECCICCSI